MDIGPSEAEQKQRPPRRGGRLWCLCKSPPRDGRPPATRIVKIRRRHIWRSPLERPACLHNPDTPAQNPYP